MQNPTITRAALIQCIEAGIARARTRGGLESYQQARLRLVALTADQVTIGDFGEQDCGCPLTQAGMGLGSEFVGDLVGRTPQTAFYEGFDPLMREVTGYHGRSPVAVVA